MLCLIAAGTALHAWRLTLSPEELTTLVRHYGVVPAEFSPTAAITSIFIHAGWLHLGSNLLPLWILGETVEDRLGHIRFLLLYVMSGLTATAIATWISPAFALPLVGSTGAVAGVAGAYLVMFPKSKVLVLVPTGFELDVDAAEVPAAFCILVWFLFVSVTGVDALAGPPVVTLTMWIALSGGLAGAAGGWLLKRRERDRVSWWSPELPALLTRRSGDEHPARRGPDPR